ESGRHSRHPNARKCPPFLTSKPWKNWGRQEVHQSRSLEKWGTVPSVHGLPRSTGFGALLVIGTPFTATLAEDCCNRRSTAGVERLVSRVWRAAELAVSQGPLDLRPLAPSPRVVPLPS